MSFYQVDSIATLYHDVSTKKIECGYIFPNDILENLDSGKKTKLITSVTSPSTTMSGITNEVIYGELFEEYSLHLLKEYCNENATSTLLSEAEINSYLQEHHATYMSNNSTFGFDFVNGFESFQENKTSLLLAPIPGLIAITILLAGFCGALQYYQDINNRIYDNVSRHKLTYIRVLLISAPVLLSTFVGFFCLVFSNPDYFSLSHMVYLCLYSLSVIGFVGLLTKIVNRKYLFTSLIPIILIGCLIFTPIFIDFSIFIPTLKPLSYLFIPYYYMDIIASTYYNQISGIVNYTALSIILFGLSFVPSRK